MTEICEIIKKIDLKKKKKEIKKNFSLNYFIILKTSLYVANTISEE